MFSVSAIEAARRYVLCSVDRALKLILFRLDNALINAALPPEVDSFIRAAVTSPNIRGVVTMANMPARRASTDAFATALFEHYALKGGLPNFRYWMATFCIDAGVTYVDKPCVDLPRLQRLVDKTLRKYGLDGIYFIEDDILMKLPGERCQRLLFHVHAVVWYADGRLLKPKKLEAAISEGKAFTNDLGAPPVRITTATLSPASVAGLAEYVTKWGVCVKRRRKTDDRKSGYRLDHELSCYTPLLTLETVLRYLQLPLYSVVRGVGAEGKAVRARWKSLMREWERAQADGDGPAVKVTPRRVKRMLKSIRHARPGLATKLHSGL